MADKYSEYHPLTKLLWFFYACLFGMIFQPATFFGLGFLASFSFLLSVGTIAHMIDKSPKTTETDLSEMLNKIKLNVESLQTSKKVEKKEKEFEKIYIDDPLHEIAQDEDGRLFILKNKHDEEIG